MVLVVQVLADRNTRIVDRFATGARIDPLTGLLNRRGLTERLAVESARAVRDREPFSIVLFDFDHFKPVTDRRNLTAAMQDLSISPGIAHGILEPLGVVGQRDTPTTETADLIAAADRALYEAKHAGRNRTLVS